MQHGKYRIIVGFLALPLLVYGVFVVSPFVQAFQISMTDWSGLVGSARFVGLDNFVRLWDSDDFWNALRHNVSMLALVPVVTLGLGLFFAFMLNVGGRRRRGDLVTGVAGSRFYKFVFFFPQVISITIIAVIWFSIYNPDPDDGMLNALLGAVGLDGLQNAWLGRRASPCGASAPSWSGGTSASTSCCSPPPWPPSRATSTRRRCWTARAASPPSSASPCRCSGTPCETGWVYMGIIALDAFALVQIMSVNMGGPDGATDVMPLRLYQTAFRDSQYGYAAAMGVAMLVVTMTFAVLALRLGRRERIEY